MQWRRPNVSLQEETYSSFKDVAKVCDHYHRKLVGEEIDLHCLYVALFHLKKTSGPYNTLTISIFVWLAIVNVGTVSPPFSMVSNCFPAKDSGKLLVSVLKRLDYRVERFQFLENMTTSDIESMWND